MEVDSRMISKEEYEAAETQWHKLYKRRRKLQIQLKYINDNMRELEEKYFKKEDNYGTL